MKGFTTACCGDKRLNQFISLFDSGTSYRKRDLGTPFDFVINQSEVYTWYSKLTGFQKEDAPISDAVVLNHNDCLAIQTNAFFATLCEKRRERYPMTREGDFEFCEKQLSKIRIQTERLTSAIVIHWHFGTIDTEMAVQLTAMSSFEDALACIRWLGPTPKFLEEHRDHLYQGHVRSHVHPGLPGLGHTTEHRLFTLPTD